MPDAPKDRSILWKKHHLTEQQFTFAETYLRNGGNARQAYIEHHPNSNLTTAGVEAYRILNNRRVRNYLAARTDKQARAQQMTADQALARLAGIALFDVRDLFDETGELIKPHLWPDSIRSVVKGISVGSQGTKFLFESSVVALRQILEIAGKLQPVTSGLDALAEALRADIQRRQQQLQSVPPNTLEARLLTSHTVEVRAVEHPVVDAEYVNPKPEG